MLFPVTTEWEQLPRESSLITIVSDVDIHLEFGKEKPTTSSIGIVISAKTRESFTINTPVWVKATSSAGGMNVFYGVNFKPAPSSSTGGGTGTTRHDLLSNRNIAGQHQSHSIDTSDAPLTNITGTNLSENLESIDKGLKVTAEDVTIDDTALETLKGDTLQEMLTEADKHVTVDDTTYGTLVGREINVLFSKVDEYLTENTINLANLSQRVTDLEGTSSTK